jgi:hypothetical protein
VIPGAHLSFGLIRDQKVSIRGDYLCVHLNLLRWMQMSTRPIVYLGTMTLDFNLLEGKNLLQVLE